MKPLVIFFSAMILCGAPQACAGVIWSQEWDSTPSFNSNYNEVQVEVGRGSLATLEPIDSFNNANPWVSNFVDPTLVDAVTTLFVDGTAGSNVNLFDINFSSAENVTAQIEVRYYLNGALVSDNSQNVWNYDGTGQGNNPVSSWTQGNVTAFSTSQVSYGSSDSAVPEPVTAGLFGSSLLALGVAWRRRRRSREKSLSKCLER